MKLSLQGQQHGEKKKKTCSNTSQMIIDILEKFDIAKEASSISNTSFSFVSDTSVTVAREDISLDGELDDSDEFFGRLTYDGHFE